MSGLEQWFAYVSYCAGAPMQARVCGPFWIWVMIAAFAILALILVAIVWKIGSRMLKRAAALRAERKHTHVDNDAIAERRWDGDKAYQTELGSEEVERRIREAVEERRAENPPFPKLTLSDHQR